MKRYKTKFEESSIAYNNIGSAADGIEELTEYLTEYLGLKSAKLYDFISQAIINGITNSVSNDSFDDDEETMEYEINSKVKYAINILIRALKSKVR